MTNNQDFKDLVALGLNRQRLEQHTTEELAMAMCAVQESGTEAGEQDRIELGLTDEGIATLYAESALGW